MDTIVYMVRHGETDANAADILQGHADHPLNDRGLLQAELAAERLKDEAFDIILSSDLSRALTTAQKIASGRTVVPMQELREWNLGAWQGYSIPQIRTLFPEEYLPFAAGDLDAAPRNGESPRQFFERVRHVMQLVTQKYNGGKILCITHGGVIKQALKVVLGTEKFSQSPACENTSISCFRHSDPGVWQLVCWNDHAHLADFTSFSGW